MRLRVMRDGCSQPWSDVIYNGFSGGGSAVPPRAQPPSGSRRGLAAAAVIAIGLGLAAAAFLALARTPPQPAAAIAGAALATPASQAPPPAAQQEPFTPALPASAPPTTERAVTAAATIRLERVDMRAARQPATRRRGLPAAARRRAEAATALANLGEAYAPQSTLGAQAAAQPANE